VNSLQKKTPYELAVEEQHDKMAAMLMRAKGICHFLKSVYSV
jgi:hypothetical protein